MDSEAGRIRLPADESEVAEVSKEMKDQCRSHFYGVRRIFQADKIMPFFAEMKKPEELIKRGKGANITIKGNFETDVQAAVAYCVMRHLFKTCVAEIRGKEVAGKKKKPYTPGEKGGGLVLQCHTALVKRRLEKMGDGRSLPDCTDNSQVAVFCEGCVADFTNIADNVRDGTLQMPDDSGLAEAVTMYHNSDKCQRSDQMYPSDRIPPQKQRSTRSGKRKFANLNN